jgi:hypothetical protein
MRLVMSTMDAVGAVDRYLLPHERRYVSVRQHPALLIVPSLLALAGLLTASILTIAVLPDNTALILAVWAACLILILRAIWMGANWAVGFLVITGDRILLVTGFPSRRVAIIPIAVINDVSFTRSIGGRLLGYGTFLIESRAPDQILQKLDYIANPEQLYLELAGMIFDNE